MPYGIFLKKIPANFNSIWIEWKSYNSWTHFQIVWSSTMIFKLKLSMGGVMNCNTDWFCLINLSTQTILILGLLRQQTGKFVGRMKIQCPWRVSFYHSHCSLLIQLSWKEQLQNCSKIASTRYINGVAGIPFMQDDTFVHCIKRYWLIVKYVIVSQSNDNCLQI